MTRGPAFQTGHSAGSSRREVLAAGGSLLAITAIAVPFSAHADRETLQRETWRLTAGAKLLPGRIELVLPSIAENGNVVPMTVRVESPMTPEDHVVAVHVLAEWNPFPTIGSFFFTPESGRAEVTTRIRLARTQDVLALAKMSDGTFYRALVHVDVSIGGCES